MALVFYLLLLFLHYSCFSSADPLYQFCGGANYTTNSTYSTNLHNLLDFFTSLNSTSFVNRIQGSNPNSVYGLILCRGDVSPSDCTSCVQNAAQDVLSRCPTSKHATIWYDNCELRYSDLRFFSSFNASHSVILYNVKNVTDRVENFIQMQRKLLDNVTNLAAYNSPLMFATGTATNGSDPTVYGLAQCTRDLTKDGCSQCLKQIRGKYTNHGFEPSQGGRVIGQSCNFRYEVYRFFQGKPTVNLTASPPPPSSTPPPPPPSSTPPPAPPSAGEEGSKSNTSKVLSIVIPLVVVIVILIIGISIFLWRRRSVKKSISSTTNLEEISDVDSISFHLSTLKIATDNFSEVHKIGEGGFGSVYKGKLDHGQEVAVKRLSMTSTQGIQELKNELFLVA